MRVRNRYRYQLGEERHIRVGSSISFNSPVNLTNLAAGE